MATTSTPTKTIRLGETQVGVLRHLASEKGWHPAPAIRDAVDMREGDAGTRQAHGVLKRLSELGYVERKGANGDARKKKGDEKPKAVVGYRITGEGRKVLKVMEKAAKG